MGTPPMVRAQSARAHALDRQLAGSLAQDATLRQALPPFRDGLGNRSTPTEFYTVALKAGSL